MKIIYVIRDRETGTVIEETTTITKAEKIIHGYEADDKAEGNYTKNFYEIITRREYSVNDFKKEAKSLCRKEPKVLSELNSYNKSDWKTAFNTWSPDTHEFVEALIRRINPKPNRSIGTIKQRNTYTYNWATQRFGSIPEEDVVQTLQKDGSIRGSVRKLFLDWHSTLQRPYKASDLSGMFNTYHAIAYAFDHGNKLVLCGNGGSMADCMHIASELQQSFEIKRGLSSEFCHKLLENNEPYAELLAQELCEGLPVVVLGCNQAFTSAYTNDNIAPSMLLAQECYSTVNHGDVLLSLSTSGGSANQIMATTVANALGAVTIALTGDRHSELAKTSQISVSTNRVCKEKTDTAPIQEEHVIMYHLLCRALERTFYSPDRRGKK